MNNPNQAPEKAASVGDTYEIEKNSEAVEQTPEAIEAAKAEEEARAKAEADEAARKLKEREEKQKAKLVAREKKAAARAEAKKGKTTRRGPKFFWKFVDYIKNVRTEMKRVVWPTRPEVGRMSVIVIIALVFFGVLIYLVDSAVTPLLYMLSGIGG